MVASDRLSGVTDITAELDGEPISLPYETSSAPGEHILKVTVLDGAGNSADISTFMIEEEKPLLPGEVSPADFAENTGVESEPESATQRSERGLDGRPLGRG